MAGDTDLKGLLATLSIDELTELLELIHRTVGEAMLRWKPKSSKGRQADTGAALEYIGTDMLHHYRDAARPGLIFTSNPTLFLTEQKFQAREGLSIENGVIGPRSQVSKALLKKLGKAGPVLEALANLSLLRLPGAAGADAAVDILQGIIRRRAGDEEES